MMRDRASLTALVVAAARALAGVDPYAHMFLPSWLSARVHDASAEKRRRSIEWLSLGLVTHIKHRTIVIDEALVEAVARGVSQVAILGAGLDTRAYRLRELTAVTVYEVDHPATQRRKLQSAHLMRSAARMLKHVAVDFERDSLDQALRDAGHRADQPTAWIWEGVTMYLPPEAVVATLRMIEARSASSSRLTMTYATGGLLHVPLVGPLLARAALATIGEPLGATYAKDEVRDLLRRHQFEVGWDGYPSEWPTNEPSPLSLRLIEERVAVADR
jgi:methyltransferase (TIGR00027 family)